MMSSSRITRNSSPSILTAWPEYFPNRTLSPTLTPIGDQLALIVTAAGADCDHFALVGLVAGGFRDHDAGRSGALSGEALDNHTVVQRTDFHFSISTVLLNMRERPEGLSISRKIKSSAQDSPEGVSRLCLILYMGGTGPFFKGRP